MTLNCPAVLRRGAIVAALALLVLPASAANLSTFRGRVWLNHYYENPDPDRFVASVFELSRNHYFNLPGHTTMGVGFFASLFRQHPDRVDEWLLYCRSLPERERRLIISALWYAGYPKGEAYLQLYAETATAEQERALLETVLSSSPALESFPIQSTAGLYLAWGVYLATGEERMLRRVFDAIPNLNDMTLRDRWWIACTAAQHENVVAWCKTEIVNQSDDVRDMLELVLSAAQTVALAR